MTERHGLRVWFELYLLLAVVTLADFRRLRSGKYTFVLLIPCSLKKVLIGLGLGETNRPMVDEFVSPHGDESKLKIALI